MIPDPSAGGTPGLAEEPEMWKYIGELQTRIRRVLGVWVVLLVGLLPVIAYTYPYLLAPLERLQLPGFQWVVLDIQTPFWLPIQLSFWGSVFLTTPWLGYEVWSFVAPALYPHERAPIRWMMGMSAVLFVAGMASGYFCILPLTYHMLTEWIPAQAVLLADMGRYMDFMLKTLWIMGFVFQTPIVTIAVLRLGWMERDQLVACRRYVIVGCFVVGMLLAPPDVVSQTLLALPLWGLFECGLVLEPYFPGKRSKASRVKATNPSPPVSQANSK